MGSTAASASIESSPAEAATLLYLAGGLFNAGERFHNLLIEKHLVELGYKVVLPQREALKFQRRDGSFDLKAIVQDCARYCRDDEVFVVACVDGPDADSGTAVEYGMAMATTGRAVVYRTDFRTSQDEGSEAGVNAMLRATGSLFVYAPCFATTLAEIDIYYAGLAKALHSHISSLSRVSHDAPGPTDQSEHQAQPMSHPRVVPGKITQPQPSPLQKTSRERLEKVVIGFLVSLVLKATLDTAYGKSNSSDGLFGLLGVAYTLNVVSFLTTMIRFVFGVFRMGEEMPPDPSHRVPLFSFACSFILFLGFYLGGLLIKDTTGFYHSVIAVHLVDAIWFFFARGWFFKPPFSDEESALRRIFIQFLVLDVVTVIVLLLIFPFPFMPQIPGVETVRSHLTSEGAGLLAMAAVCIVDFWYHGTFFLQGLDAYRKRRGLATSTPSPTAA